MMQVPGLFITESADKGRGVYIAQELNPGDLIEICPLIVIPNSEVEFIHKTILHDYYFLMDQPKGAACIALGYGSIYNHSQSPNAMVVFDYDRQHLEIKCIKKIGSGEEILIDYTDGGKEDAPLWFEPK